MTSFCFGYLEGYAQLLLLPSSKLKLRTSRLQMSKVTNATDGEEPILHYPCPVCAFSTVYRNSIQRHVKLNHPAVEIAKGKRGPHTSINSEVTNWFMIYKKTYIFIIMHVQRMPVLKGKRQQQRNYLCVLLAKISLH